MAEPFIGEICCFGFNFAPRGWAFCNGQIQSIAQNTTLYAILGTIYGGDGVQTFALPNLQGRIPMHWGNSTTGLNTEIGEVLGSTAVTLTLAQLPQHNHSITAVSAPQGTADERFAVPSPQAYLSASKAPNQPWQNPPQQVNATFSPRAIMPSGNSMPHNNMQPYLALNFCISLYGVFPSRN